MAKLPEIKTIENLSEIKKQFNEKMAEFKFRVYVCAGAGCISSNCHEVKDELLQVLADFKIKDQVNVVETGCIGTCALGPVMVVTNIEKGNKQDFMEGVFYTKLAKEDIKAIVESHLIKGVVKSDKTYFEEKTQEYVHKLKDIDFFKNQTKIALRNCGSIDYSSLEEYIARGGYMPAANSLLTKTSQDVVDEMKKSGLRGRGGAGFPAGIKWESGLKAEGKIKYIVCNADEGDPGAFMDRSILEGDPHSIIEGMLIAGYAIGATKGFVYVRAEYPVAVERLENAIKDARESGLLGKNIFNSGFDFDIEIRIGAGAFVCGEETALMSSIEGRRGEPRQKPPLPFEKGIFQKPTIINNVETLANVPIIIEKGSEWFAGIGSEKSKGTKVFALAGDICNTGIVEVPMGYSLGEILFNIGGGIPNKKKFKAAQTGGPSGGCITKEYLNTPIDYDSLSKLGTIMGSGGLISMDEDTCMVDMARFFMEFVQDESCGKCLPCRLGTKRMLEILERITRGEGREGDIELLEEIGNTVRDTATCGLGTSAPNPVLSTIKYFREEYEEHIKYKYCRAGVCADLFLSPCQNACPANINVPGYIALIAEGRNEEAYRLIRKDNPFPAVCGRVCTHPCEAKCRRGTLDESIAICDLKMYVSDEVLKQVKTTTDIPLKKNGKSVGIIGAGPSGLTCGYYLAMLGYDVDVYESNSVAGGMLAYGIPEYRLPEKVLNNEIDMIKQVGVKIHLDTQIGKDINFEELKSKHDAIYVAVGTQLSNKINIPGEDLKNVYHGLDFLRDVGLKKDVKIGKSVAIIGGGNTAIDSARTAKRLGASEVTILYRRLISDMPADEREINEALEEGIKIEELILPISISADGNACQIECQKMTMGEFDNSGRRKPNPIENSNFKIKVDTVIPAVSQYTELSFVEDENIEMTKWGTINTDKDTMMTKTEGLFAGGDVIRGPDTVITAIRDGKLTAISIDKYLGGEGVLNTGEDIAIPMPKDEQEIKEHERYAIKLLDPDSRKKSFDEVNLGYDKQNAVCEANRCLRCDRRV